MNLFQRLFTWLRKPPQGTRPDGSPRRYRQPVDLTYVTTRTYDSWSGTADQMFGDRVWKPAFRYHDFSLIWNGSRFQVSALDDKLLFTFRPGQSFPARIDPGDLSKVWCLMGEHSCSPWPPEDPEEDDNETEGPLFAVDVHYADDGSALAAGIAFGDWHNATPQAEVTTRIAETAPYEPGAFYKRELPCILALLDWLPRRPSVIIIDGYVTLGADARDGLGMHLWRALDEKVPVIGVAKTAFAGTPKTAELLRGQSIKPLYITAVGISQEDAKACIRAMHGDHRLPTLLTAADRLCRRPPA
ncbi:endonuclease V [Seohaeicola saemankumensis]|nr:endonuclease V [Seohaeicola saemankumensis]MCA0869681.1 endonuclease V [Seohaeicola saemankumensis]